MKLSMRTKISYGLPGTGDSTVYNLVGTFAMFFLSTVVGMDPGMAGTIAAIGSIWETIVGATMGYISDNIHTRMGRRKPFLLLAAFPLALFTALLFTTIDAGPGFRFVYYAAMMILFWTCFSMFFVPYLAWGAELTQDYDERTVLRGFTFFFNNLGMVFGMILPTVIVDYLVNSGRTAAQSWQLMAVFCGLCAALTIFIGAAGIKVNIPKEELPERKGTREVSIRKIAATVADMVINYWEILKLRTIRFIILASIFYLVGYGIFGANRMYYFTYNMELSTGKITLIMTVMTFASVVFLPVILAATKKWDKRTIYIAGMSFGAAFMAVFGFFGTMNMVTVVIFSIAYCVSSICYWQLMPAMIYDVCEVDQLVNNKERAGLVISLQTLSESLANAVGLQMLGLILKFAGFNGEAAAQADTTLVWTNLCMTIIPAVFMVLSIVMIVCYPVTKEMYTNILDALECRKNGEEIDMTEFGKLK